MAGFAKISFYRLNVVPIVVPPLRKRQEDILVIADHVLETCSLRTEQAPARVFPASA
ncbi:MAG: hypothetical protein QM706_19945 [Nitrospira sp.]